MIEYLAIVVLLPFTVSMVVTYVVGCMAHGVPLTPWFVKGWKRSIAARIEARRVETRRGSIHESRKSRPNTVRCTPDTQETTP